VEVGLPELQEEAKYQDAQCCGRNVLRGLSDAVIIQNPLFHLLIAGSAWTEE